MKEGLRQVNKIQTGLTLSLFKFNHYWVHGKDSEYIYHHRLVNFICSRLEIRSNIYITLAQIHLIIDLLFA